MLKRSASLDQMFQALADPTRRAIVERLTQGPASVSRLAAPMAMSLVAVGQHLKVLEASGLISTEKVGRVRMCRVERSKLAMAENWIAEQTLWTRRLGRLGEVLADMVEIEMVERSIVHGSFTVKRSYPHAPAKVFRAWSDPAVKRQWYGGPGQDDTRRVFEFEVGGRENNFGTVGDLQFALESVYYDIVPENRIVYAYDVKLNNVLTSVSVAAVEFRAAGGGTELTMTEHGAFLDGHDNADERQGGADWVLDRLGEILNEQK
jgi:uncharacterized protein YndB with AHSA1/START domain/DNA-binding transcriptional ArsR family regulator